MPKRDLANFLVPSNPIALAQPTIQQSTRPQPSAGRRAINPDKNMPHVNNSGGKQQETTVSLPKYGNLEVSVGTSVKSVIRPDADNFPRGYASSLSRGEFGGFQCTSRGGSRLVSLPGQQRKQAQQQQQSLAAADTTTATPDVSVIEQGGNGGVSLKEVWKWGMRAKAPLLTEVDPATIGRPFTRKEEEQQQQQQEQAESAEGQKQQQQPAQERVRILRVQPEWLGRGAVQPPQAQVVEIDRRMLDDDAAHLMTPAQRRELMETQRRAREGLIALREVQAARTKLSRTCQKLYPHGALGCTDGPYSGHPDEFAYKELAGQLHNEDRKVSRKSKKEAGEVARPHDTGAAILNVTRRGEAAEAPAERKTGLQTRTLCKPKDQLRAFAVGV